MSTKTASLYTNQNGMMCCIDHGGSYLRSEYAHKPERNTYTTPLDLWKRIDDDYAAEWVAIIGSAPKCEMCR